MAMRLTAVHGQAIQGCFDSILAHLAELGLTITFSTEMTEWVNAITNAPRRGIVNPTFDPAHNDLTPENAFWVAATDRATGQLVACIANRVFITHDYRDLLRTQRLWYASGPRRLVELTPQAEAMPRIAGRVGHHGGLWIHPDWRKRGLSGHLTKLVRSASLRRFDVDWHCGSVFAAIAEKGLPIAPETGYGYPRMVLAIDSWFPITDKPERVYLRWISRPEMLAQLAGDLTRRLIHDRDREAVGFSAMT
jgi:hypothetical protein